MQVLSANQRAAIQKLEKLRVGALFMEPGTGKTRTAIELVESSQTDFVLWIVPFQTKQNLLQELKKWGFDKPFLVTGVESIGSSDRIYLELLQKIKQYKKVFIVVDESLKIKNDLAKRTKRVMKLGEHSYYRLVLNGTPLSRNIVDLYAQMRFLSPKILGMGYWEYVHTFCEFTEIKQTNGYTKRYISGYDNVEYLYSLIEPYVFSAKLNLNVGSNEEDVLCDIYDTDKYHELKSELLEYLESFDDVYVLGFFQQMQQSYSLDEGKLDELDALMKRLRSDKVIIFCKFIKTRECLQKKYPNAKVMTYGKGALGLNLQAYKSMIFYDKTWNYATLEQSKRRIYRLGQSEDVKYYYMTADIGLDRMMERNIATKGDMLKEFKAASKHLKKKQLKKLL